MDVVDCLLNMSMGQVNPMELLLSHYFLAGIWSYIL